jgi:hypothetical protein
MASDKYFRRISKITHIYTSIYKYTFIYIHIYIYMYIYISIYLASRSLSQAAILSLEIFSSDILLAGINSALQLRATYIRIIKSFK